MNGGKKIGIFARTLDSVRVHNQDEIQSDMEKEELKKVKGKKK